MSASRGRARFGILVPFTNSNLEPDMALMRPDGVSLHFGRMGGYDEDEVPDAAQMHGLGAADLDVPLSLLMGVHPDVIIYGCTSATLTHGLDFDRALADRIKTDSGAATVTAAGALVNALKFLGINSVGFASPYVAEINDMAISFLSEAGVRTVSREEVDDALDNVGQGAMEPNAVLELGRAADSPEAQAIVLSCTDMRSVEIIAELEAILGKPVITSNQAIMFEAMQTAGIGDEQQGFGRLMQEKRL